MVAPRVWGGPGRSIPPVSLQRRGWTGRPREGFRESGNIAKVENCFFLALILVTTRVVFFIVSAANSQMILASLVLFRGICSAFHGILSCREGGEVSLMKLDRLTQASHGHSDFYE